MFVTKLFCTGTLLLSFISGAAQQIRNVEAEFDGEKVIIKYDLLSDDSNDRFNIGLYSSHDNFQQKLSLLVGDAGENIEPGNGKRITWDAQSSLPPDFNQEISFKIKANLLVSLHHPNRLEIKPIDFNAYKRGGLLNIEWNGGGANELIAIELLKGEEVINKLGEVENPNQYSWNIPKNTKTGKEYSIRISKISNPLVQAVSHPFEIKPRISMLVKLIPLLVTGGVIATLLSGSDGNPGEPEEPDLPGPPKL